MLFLLGFLACNANKDATTLESGSCNNTTDCAEGTLCQDNRCIEIECQSSLDCEVEEYCSADYQCENGCENDDDCYAGDSCNGEEKECESYGCRSTDLDCAVGEFCDTSSQECYTDSFSHCSPCSANEVYVSGIDGGLCIPFTSTETYCEQYISVDVFSGTIAAVGNSTGCSSGQICLIDGSASVGFDWDSLMDIYAGVCSTAHSIKTCNADLNEEQCPRGFDCIEDIYGNREDPTAPDIDACIGDCPYYTENGHL